MKPLVPHPGSPWVAAAVREVLAAQAGERSASVVAPPDVPWDDVADAARRHRVLPMLVEHLEALGVPGPVAANLRVTARTVLSRGLANRADLDTVAKALQAAGVDALFVKGAALMSVMGLDPALRGAGDVDVLVGRHDVQGAEAALRSAGWDQHRAIPTEGWRGRHLFRFISEWPLRHEARGEVDLHWRLGRWRGEFDDTFSQLSGRSVEVLGVRTLCAEDALRHMATHGRKEMWSTMRHLVDVVRLVRVLDPATVTRLCERNPTVRLAVATASRLAPEMSALVPHGGRALRLAGVAWENCVSLQTSLSERSRLRGLAAFRMRLRTEWWYVSTAPNPRTVLSQLTGRLVPWGLFVTTGGLLRSYVAAASRAFRGGERPDGR